MDIVEGKLKILENNMWLKVSIRWNANQNLTLTVVNDDSDVVWDSLGNRGISPPKHFGEQKYMKIFVYSTDYYFPTLTKTEIYRHILGNLLGIKFN